MSGRARVDSTPHAAFAIWTARFSIASGFLFVFLLTSLHILEPEFDPTWRFISEYALGSFGWMMQLSFFLIAASLASIGFVILSQQRSIVAYIGLIILWISAAGLFLAGVYVTDPIAAYQQHATFSGRMHVLGASLDYTPVAALVLSFALIRKESWQRVRVRLIVTSAITLALMFAFMLFLPRDGVFGPGVYAGFVGRLLLVSYVAWIVSVGRRYIKLAQE
ncbi:DUF998 domain-containing protein [Cohnella ginsengisoli]|uniref:DUF998 domain-containing protein n=1 Tax=Cohnella ginsengisoli TaxID=425004 RepID=A0A9X4QLQ4_9BACL|nr:DUF998 domain-containing protein [Cohnella ginsengisoli]MDG0790551.1 DUF998 domain-containing protein [Cohnella ginsengisoli]